LALPPLLLPALPAGEPSPFDDSPHAAMTRASAHAPARAIERGALHLSPFSARIQIV
jgi:hypothetical protein